MAYKQDRSGSTRGLIQRSAWKGNSLKCSRMGRVAAPYSFCREPGCHKAPALARGMPRRLWSGKILAGFVLSLLMRLLVRLFLPGFLLGTTLGVEHNEYDHHKTH